MMFSYNNVLHTTIMCLCIHVGLVSNHGSQFPQPNSEKVWIWFHQYTHPASIVLSELSFLLLHIKVDVAELVVIQEPHYV